MLGQLQHDITGFNTSLAHNASRYMYLNSCTCIKPLTQGMPHAILILLIENLAIKSSMCVFHEQSNSLSSLPLTSWLLLPRSETECPQTNSESG